MPATDADCIEVYCEHTTSIFSPQPIGWHCSHRHSVTDPRPRRRFVDQPGNAASCRASPNHTAAPNRRCTYRCAHAGSKRKAGYANRDHLPI